jgi:hypothetical protein
MRGCVAARLRGYVAVWLCGCVAVWLCGCVAVWRLWRLCRCAVHVLALELPWLSTWAFRGPSCGHAGRRADMRGVMQACGGHACHTSHGHSHTATVSHRHTATQPHSHTATHPHSHIRLTMVILKLIHAPRPYLDNHGNPRANKCAAWV